MNGTKNNNVNPFNDNKLSSILFPYTHLLVSTPTLVMKNFALVHT